MKPGPKFKPLSERYKVADNGCWLWTGAITTDRYGFFDVSGKKLSAHRYFYEFWTSTRIPHRMQLDHLCRQRSCVNPSHLEIVTPRENTLRSLPYSMKARQTECLHGHPLSGDNLYRKPNGSRECRICRQMQMKVFYRRQYAGYYNRYNKIVDEGSGGEVIHIYERLVGKCGRSQGQGIRCPTHSGGPEVG